MTQMFSEFRSGWLDRFVVHAENTRVSEFDLDALARAERKTSLVRRIVQALGLIAADRGRPQVRKAHAVVPTFPNALDDLGLLPAQVQTHGGQMDSVRWGAFDPSTPVTVANLNRISRVA